MIRSLLTTGFRFSKFTNQKYSSYKDVTLNLSSLVTSYARSQGPGGQNVNKVNSKAQIRLSLNTCEWLQPSVIEKIKVSQARSVNQLGELILTSQQHRQQNRNLQQCHKKLKKIIFQGSLVKKQRVIAQFKECMEAKDRRITEKKRKGEVKSLRKGPRDDD